MKMGALDKAIKKRRAEMPDIEIKPHPKEVLDLSHEQVREAKERLNRKPSGKSPEHDPFADYGHGYVPRKKNP